MLTPPAAPAWFRYAADSGPRVGIARPHDDAVELLDAGDFDPIVELGRGGMRADDLARLAEGATRLATTPRFLVPQPAPSKILCLGKNFAAHAAEFGHEVPDEPLFFTKLVDSLRPHGEPIVLPHWIDTRIDHEIELAVLLGFDGPPRKYVTLEDALDLVAGYSIFNDVTARRMQGDDRGAQKPWLRCKSFDTFGPCGPWVAPADAIDIRDAKIELRVNDELRQSSTLSLMVVGIAEAIAYLSRHTSLRSGDLLAMGTPEGVGPLQDGDLVIGTIDGLGTLANTVVRETPV